MDRSNDMPHVIARDFLRIAATPPANRLKVRGTFSGPSHLVNEPRDRAHGARLPDIALRTRDAPAGSVRRVLRNARLHEILVEHSIAWATEHWPGEAVFALGLAYGAGWPPIPTVGLLTVAERDALLQDPDEYGV